MSIDADLRRLDEIIGKLTGDKGLRDEAKAIVRRMIDALPSTLAWWDRHGPEPEQEWRPGHPLPPRLRALVDYIVVNGPSQVAAVAASLGIEEDNLRRSVSRADTQLLERGGKATIHISAGMVQTATTSIVVGPSMRRDD